MLDQYTALGMPYENPPHEVIIERWSKDIKRLHLLLPLYPIPPPTISPNTLNDLEIPSGNCIITGWAALSYYNAIADNKEFDEKKCSIPQTFVTVMSDDWESIPNTQSEETKFFNSMMGYPRHLERTGLHIHDTLGLKIGVLKDTRIASLPALMWYFMHRWLHYGDLIDQLGATQTFEHMRSGKWKLDIHTYGRYVWNLAFVHYMRTFNNVANERIQRPSNMAFNNEECDAQPPTFDTKKSIYFSIDGSPCERWEPLFDLEDLEIKSESPFVESISPLSHQ
jgi:hypothetical protein